MIEIGAKVNTIATTASNKKLFTAYAVLSVAELAAVSSSKTAGGWNWL